MRHPTTPARARHHDPLSTALRVGTALFIGVLLALFWYGFRQGLQGVQVPMKVVTLAPTTLDVVAVTATVPLSTAAVTPVMCDMTAADNGGSGRCYPGCVSDAECTETGGYIGGGYVSTYAVCREWAVAHCGPTDACVRSVCGDTQTVKCMEHHCTRPNLALSRMQCQRTTPGLGSITDSNACRTEEGACYERCATDMDCTHVQGDFTRFFGTCVRGSGAIPAHCSEPLPARSSEACVATSRATFWAGSCVANGAMCLTAAECQSVVPRPGVWVGMCDGLSGQRANCTELSMRLCRRGGQTIHQCERKAFLDGGAGRCARVCETDRDCPSTDTRTCQAAVSALCIDTLGHVDSGCVAILGTALCPDRNSCVRTADAARGLCAVATGAPTEASCLSRGVSRNTAFADLMSLAPGDTIWVGQCRDVQSLCGTDQDCSR